MGRWQLRTWTKGTGAAVEPVGARDAPPVPARPGRVRTLPPSGPWVAREPVAPEPRAVPCTDAAARRRHARRYVDDEAIAALEQLEAELRRAAS